MADWIKMRSGLLTNPKVIRMAKLLASNPEFLQWLSRGLGLSRDVTRDEMRDVTFVTRVTVGSLLSVWASVNDAANQAGFLKGISLSDIDDMAGVPGFGDAMGAVGWAEEGDDGTFFPNFDEHNSVAKQRVGEGKTAKTSAERMREFRQRQRENRDVTSDASQLRDVTRHSDGREEKRREDIKPMSGKPDDAGSREVLDYLNDQTGKSYRAVETNLKLIRAKLSTGATVDDCKAVIDAKVAEWSNNRDMEQYLRPETLFGARKFEQYLGQIKQQALPNPAADAALAEGATFIPGVGRCY